MRTGLIYVIVIFIFACSHKQAAQPNTVNIQAFLKAEIQFLTQHQMGLQKTLQFKNHGANLVLKKVNWEQELRPFLELKYPGIAQLNDYQLTSVQINSSARMVILKAINSQAQYNFIELLLVQEKLVSFTCYQLHTQLFSHSASYFSYQSKKGYRLQLYNQLIGKQKLVYDVQGKILH